MKIAKEQMLSLITFGYLFNLYMFSEQIKIESVLLLFLFILFAIFFRVKKWTLTFSTMLLFIYILVFGLLSVNSNFVLISDLFEFISSLIIGILFYTISLDKRLRISQLNAIKYVCIIVFLGCLLQILRPNVLINLNKMRMGSNKFLWFSEFLRNGFMVGFSFQTAVTGFYLTILIGYLFCYLVSKNKYNRTDILYIILTLICFILLFKTGKRIFIALTLVVALIIFLFYNKKHLFKIIGIVMIMGFVFYILLYHTDIGQILIQRSMRADPTRGRSNIYAMMWHWFIQHPFVGNGLTSTQQLLKGYLNGHNIYLQILMESGVLGAFILIPFFLINIIKGFKILHFYIKNNKNSYELSLCIFIELIFLGWGLTGNPLYDVYPFLVYMIAISVVNSFIHEEREKEGVVIE